MVTVAIDIGLLVGIGMSVLCLIVKGLKPYVCLLGCVPGTEIYLDIEKYKRVSEPIILPRSSSLTPSLSSLRHRKLTTSRSSTTRAA